MALKRGCKTPSWPVLALEASYAARLVLTLAAVCLLASGGINRAVGAGGSWIVAGPNRSSSGVPTCSYCLNVWTAPASFTGARVTLWRCVGRFPNEAGWVYDAATFSIQIVDTVSQVVCLDAGTQDRYDGQASIYYVGVSPFRLSACDASRPEQQWFLSEERNSGTIRNGLKSADGEDLYMVQGELPAGIGDSDGYGYFNLYLSTEAGLLEPAVLTSQFTFQASANYVPGLAPREPADSEGGGNLVQNGGFERCTLLASPAASTPPGSNVGREGELFTLCGWVVNGSESNDFGWVATWISTRFPNGIADAQSNSSILLHRGTAIHQTIPTRPDTLYQLTLSLAGYLYPNSSVFNSFQFCSNPGLGVRVKFSLCNGSVSGGTPARVEQQVSDSKWGTVTASFRSCSESNQTDIAISAEGQIDEGCGLVVDNVVVGTNATAVTNGTDHGTQDGNQTAIASRSDFPVLLGSVAASGLVLLLLGAMATYWYRRRRYRPVLQLSPEAHARIQFFSVAQIHKATKSLSPEYFLGEGGFGSVYKAEFPDGVMGAVKVEKATSKASKNSAFAEEVALLQQVHHRNLVNLIGLCIERGARMLVFEYLPNGNLSDKLHSTNAGLDPLPWLSRLKIVYQVACALKYLHHATSPPIVHRDIKSSNILLTSTNAPKLADFGLSKAAPTDASQFPSVETDVKGSFGYMDPQYVRSGVFSSKSDVYSYGVLVLELITGQRAIKDGNLLSKWALEYLHNNTTVHDMVDPHVLAMGGWNSQDLVILVDLVKMCLQDDAQTRPTMEQVVSFLAERDFGGVPRVPTPSGDMDLDEQDEEPMMESLSAKNSHSTDGITSY